MIHRQYKWETMADRKQFVGVKEADAELGNLLEISKHATVDEEDLREQRISFAFGNALGSETITKESVRRASENLRLMPK